MKKSLNRILEHLFVVLGAFLFSQFPLFIHQYQQQLIGHVNELKWQISAMNEAAASSGKSIDEYVHKFITHSDVDIARQGVTMKTVALRWNKLSTSLLKLSEATVVTRPIQFLRYLEWDICKSTFAGFQRGLPFTSEGALYIFLGMIVGYVVSLGVSLFGKKMFRTKNAVA